MKSTAAPSVDFNNRMIDSRRKMLKSLKLRMNRFLETAPSYAVVAKRTNGAEPDGARQPATAEGAKSAGEENR